MNSKIRTINSIYLVGDKKIYIKGLKEVLSCYIPNENIWDISFSKLDTNLLPKAELMIICTDRIEVSKQKIAKYGGEYPIIVISNSFTFSDIAEYLLIKCYCLLKSTSNEETIIGCINLCMQGIIFLDRIIEPLLTAEMERQHRIGLLPLGYEFTVLPTTREIKIAGYILSGMENAEIAKNLFLTTGTVKNIISVMLEKYGFRTRAQIIGLLLR